MGVTFNFNMRSLVCFIVTAVLFDFATMAPAEESPVARPPLHSAELEALTKILLLDIERLSRYWATKELPPIAIVSQDEIDKTVCRKPCAVRAAFMPDRGVLLAETLDPINQQLDRSILVHELVHFLQEINHRFSELSPCKRWFHRELEAYAVQNQYLYRINANQHVGGILDASMCKEHPEEQTSNAFQPDPGSGDRQ